MALEVGFGLELIVTREHGPGSWVSTAAVPRSDGQPERSYSCRRLVSEVLEAPPRWRADERVRTRSLDHGASSRTSGRRRWLLPGWTDPLWPARHFVGQLLWIPMNQAMFTGDYQLETESNLQRHADAAVLAFLTGYGPRSDRGRLRGSDPVVNLRPTGVRRWRPWCRALGRMAAMLTMTKTALTARWPAQSGGDRGLVTWVPNTSPMRLVERIAPRSGRFETGRPRRPSALASSPRTWLPAVPDC